MVPLRSGRSVAAARQLVCGGSKPKLYGGQSINVLTKTHTHMHTRMLIGQGKKWHRRAVKKVCESKINTKEICAGIWWAIYGKSC